MLKGKLVQLQAVERNNLSKYVEWLNNPEVSQYLNPGVRYPMTMAEEEDWFEAMTKKENQRLFAIHTLEDERLIGNVGLNAIDWKNRSAVVGIFIGNEEDWGKGYGTEAMRLCLYLAFQELDLQRIELNVYDFNPRAIKSYQKLGFVEEGRKRRFLYRNGKYHDDIIMSILREEYMERYQKEDEVRWQPFYEEIR